jgi:hypothetical protein
MRININVPASDKKESVSTCLQPFRNRWHLQPQPAWRALRIAAQALHLPGSSARAISCEFA